MHITEIYKNPLIYGQALLAPAQSILHRIQREIQEINTVAEEEKFLKLFQGKLPKPDAPVQMTWDEVIKLQLSRETYRSHRPSLRGKVFSIDRSTGTPLVSVEDPNPEAYNPLTERCKHRSRLTGYIALGILTAPLTIPALATGMAVKALSNGCKSPYIRPLHTQQLAVGDYSAVAPQIEEWRRIASTKTSRVASQQKVFSDCERISRAVGQCLRDPSCASKTVSEVHVCYDDRHTLQGILLLSNDVFNKRLEITNILTHPHNIRSSINTEEYARVQGAGTALMQAAIERCRELGLSSLYLEGLDSSKSFYQRFGFKDAQRKFSFAQEGDYAMTLPVAPR
jgi:N-acetylglutamate synthase-like GNAT family acetyltransferase